MPPYLFLMTKLSLFAKITETSKTLFLIEFSNNFTENINGDSRVKGWLRKDKGIHFYIF